MKIIFMGTPGFAVPPLEALLNSEHEVIAVVTQPDRPRGRGKAPGAPPVKETAVKAGIPVLQPERAGDALFLDEIRELSPDICVVAAYGQILPSGFLNIPEYGCVNIHASLLPRYRGASPIQWAIINGDEKSGVTTMQMAAGMDTGDILEQAEIQLDPKETYATLCDRLSRLGAELILSTLCGLERGGITPVPQDPAMATTVKKIDKSMEMIDFSSEACYIERLIRALDPSPGASTTCAGRRLKIWGADAEPAGPGACCGTVLEAQGGRLYIQTGNGILKVTSLQLEGKKRMDTASFLRGFKLQTGVIMGE